MLDQTLSLRLISLAISHCFTSPGELSIVISAVKKMARKILIDAHQNFYSLVPRLPNVGSLGTRLLTNLSAHSGLIISPISQRE